MVQGWVTTLVNVNLNKPCCIKTLKNQNECFFSAHTARLMPLPSKGHFVQRFVLNIGFNGGFLSPEHPPMIKHFSPAKPRREYVYAEGKRGLMAWVKNRCS